MRPQGAPMWPKATHGGRRPPAREASVPAPQGPRRRAAKRLELLGIYTMREKTQSPSLQHVFILIQDFWDSPIHVVDVKKKWML